MIEPAYILQSIVDPFNTFLQNIRIIDFLDIIIISFFLYIVLNWLRQSASRRSLFSFLILIIIYIIARFTGMYLTQLLIQGLFIVILIGIIVVFQSDMRRIVDRIGNWKFFNSSPPGSNGDVTSIITEAAAKMAEQRIGALIAFKGKESWDRHVHGGIELDGKITIPLLLSIFNVKAPGHDGAVLCDGQKILKFGVHLPLSTNLYKLSRGGTRHTAALGLSERCDALLVVVSEERGVISIAQNGQIKQLETHNELKSHLNDFWAEHHASSSLSFRQWRNRRSLKTAIASVGLAFVLWLSLAYPSETVYRTYAVPIEYSNLESTKYALQDSMPHEARITLSGSEQAFRTFQPSQLLISFDLASEDVVNNELEINSDDINLPAGLELFRASPPSLKLTIQHFEPVELPVKVPLTGKLAGGLRFISATPSPKTVTVLVDTSAAPVDSISTGAVDLSQIQKKAVQQKRLQLESNSFRAAQNTPAKVSVTIEVRKE